MANEKAWIVNTHEEHHPHDSSWYETHVHDSRGKEWARQVSSVTHSRSKKQPLCTAGRCDHLGQNNCTELKMGVLPSEHQESLILISIFHVVPLRFL